jgi:shikimate dehydrogenase
MADRYAVIGHPVTHSKSPWIHREFARATGQDIEYVALEAPLDAFERTVEAFRAQGGKGANVTLPFKEHAYRYCTVPSAAARLAQAVNTLVFDERGIGGDNTDGSGLLRDLTVNLGREVGGRAVLLLGAGGAARGVLGPLSTARPARLVLANRTADKAQKLAQRLAPAVEPTTFASLRDASFDLVINATSAGLSGESPSIPLSVFGKGALAYDMVYGRDTPFLALARACGCETSDGLGMLVEQAADSFRIWRGVRPETAPVIAVLRAR